MLIPRFSLRWLLGLLTLSGCFFVGLAAAWQGQAWALGVTAGFITIGLVIGLQAILYFVARGMALAGIVRVPEDGENEA